MNLDNFPSLLKIGDAAKILSVSVWTLRAWDKKGTLKPVRIGTRRDRRYRKEDIIKILDEGLI